MAVIDSPTCRERSWHLSNTLDAEFCVEALAEALERYGRAEIFNTDHGSQFTTNSKCGQFREQVSAGKTTRSAPATGTASPRASAST